MQVTRILVLALVLGGLNSAVNAEEKKIDYAKMILGKWEASKVEPGTIPEGTLVEFTKDGKFKVSGNADGMDLALDGTYTIEGDKFTFKLKIGDDERSQTITITKLTETEMATKDKDDKVVEFKKKK